MVGGTSSPAIPSRRATLLKTVLRERPCQFVEWSDDGWPTASAGEGTPGVSIPYVDQGGSDGVTVVLIHGLGDSLRSYEPVQAHLPEGMRTLVPSLRGHGDADRPQRGYTPTGLDGVELEAHVAVDELRGRGQRDGVDVESRVGAFVRQSGVVTEHLQGEGRLGRCETMTGEVDREGEFSP